MPGTMDIGLDDRLNAYLKGPGKMLWCRTFKLIEKGLELRVCRRKADTALQPDPWK